MQIAIGLSKDATGEAAGVPAVLAPPAPANDCAEVIALTGRSLSELLQDYEAAAASAGLVYASTELPGVTRRRCGRGFLYVGLDGRRIDDRAALARIRALAIPPAWTEVWICADPNGHVQAIGRDQRGRRQYRYHEAFRRVRDTVKYEHIIEFAQRLPALRARVTRDMAAPGLARTKVLATVARLLETTMIRIGNPEYAKENESFGLTTLHTDHVCVEGSRLRFSFRGKSGKAWNLDITDRRVARVVRLCQELPGQHLFQYVDDEGRQQAISSTDVNGYLKEAAGAPVTAKDFRTWTGTVLAAQALLGSTPPSSRTEVKRNLAAAIRQVAARLGNTPAVCRSCYVHPEVLEAYAEGRLAQEMDAAAVCAAPLDGLLPEEQAVLAFLERRHGRPLAA